MLLVDDEVARFLELFALLGLDVATSDRAGRQPRNDPIDFVIEVGRFLGRARDDQRRPRFVDEDAVDFVDDREVVPALHVVREVELHVVAEVVEPELVVGAVGDVGAVGHLPFLIVQVVLDDADRHAKESIDAAHPLRVAAGEVVVDGDDVDAFAGERIQVRGQGCDQRLAFAGLHLGDPAPVQDDAADQLDVEVPHVERAAAGLADHGEGFRQQIIERLACGQPAAELDGLAPQLLVGELADLRLFRVDFGDQGLDALQFAIVRRTDDFGYECIDNHQECRVGSGYPPIISRIETSFGRRPRGHDRSAHRSIEVH